MLKFPRNQVPSFFSHMLLFLAIPHLFLLTMYNLQITFNQKIIIVPGKFDYYIINPIFPCSYAWFYGNYSFGTKSINLMITLPGINAEKSIASFTWKRTSFWKRNALSYPAFTRSKLTIKTQERRTDVALVSLVTLNIF